ncbi:hypothetical protein IWQ48_004178 [Labrenzia sp. EL_13]|nr:hypothetical protein [Labrenzia sp. EL_162]MBG6163677.1 hypothetical protein [Labrenzia sp. EL_195]MBG6195349.1 hypothetical protein [Labrenzia sp. EL_159]MBG6203021.1 hypothetical protein [Labrenzia sp. EL_13]
MKKKKVVLLDQAQIGRILKSGGFAALDAVIGRGDKFLFAAQAFQADKDFDKIPESERAAFKAWLQEKTYAGKVVTVDDIDTTSKKEQKGYDPEGRAGRRGTNKELWDMSARKFMLENQDIYDFEVISADHAFLDNRVGKHHPLKRIHFERVSMKSLMSWLLVHPNVDLTEANFNSIRETALKGHFGESHHLEKLQPDVPESYEAALKLKEEARQTNVLEDREKRKTNRKRAAKRGRKLFDLGAPIFITGAAAYAMHDLITREAEESGLPYLEAAQSLGIEFTREQLKNLAAEAGIDLAITFTPIGPLKKAWDVLGNIDDVVSLMQLYGEAYPDNEVIQQMAGLADDVADSAALAAYVEGRDALTGAVGGVLDGVFGSAESEEEAAEAIGKVRGAIRTGGEELDAALANGAGTNELTDLLLHRAEESAPARLVEPDFRNPDLSPGRVLEGEAPLSDVDRLPGSDPILPPSIWPEERLHGAGRSGADDLAAASGQAGSGATGSFSGRKTSYDRIRRFGGSPEEEAQALAEYNAQLKQSLIYMRGDEEVAKVTAARILALEWGLTAFATHEDGTVIKYPVEKVYSDLEEDGFRYVREDAEQALTERGIRAKQVYVMPNRRTGSDWLQGGYDEDGYGPRMTLSYDDEAGERRVVTESFQANVDRAWQRSRMTHMAQLRKKAEEFGLTQPKQSEAEAKPMVPEAPAAPQGVPAAPSEHPDPTENSVGQPERSPELRPMPRVQPMPSGYGVAGTKPLPGANSGP